MNFGSKRIRIRLEQNNGLKLKTKYVGRLRAQSKRFMDRESSEMSSVGLRVPVRS